MSRGRQRKPIGFETKSGGCIYVKVGQPSVWRQKHRHIWEEAYGPIPDGFFIRFIDGDKNNFSLENLALVSNEEKLLSHKIGTEKVQNSFVMVKISVKPSVWRMKHHLIWEAVHGPIPDDHLVIFADGDHSNFNLDNLVLISRSDSIRKLNLHPVGTERTRSNKLQIKGPDNVWHNKRRYIWEAAYGKIPKGYNVHFVDGDRSNYSLDNLMLISRQESFYLMKNDMLKHKGELMKTAVNVAKLSLAAFDKKKRKKN